MRDVDLRRLRKIVRTGRQLLAYLVERRITPEQVKADYAIQWTVTTPLYNIGEHTYQLSKELKETYPGIPWAQVSGMRHRLVHNYEDTNWDIINIVLFDELEAYIMQLEGILLDADNGDR